MPRRPNVATTHMSQMKLLFTEHEVTRGCRGPGSCVSRCRHRSRLLREGSSTPLSRVYNAGAAVAASSASDDGGARVASTTYLHAPAKTKVTDTYPKTV
ncbi:unnamed protein product [Plutella xylostella]|uniref:(diamondback moth) hypothetical protein n=1 Tax=Plutella xylostella TaxID=51655 RepID=A0A8S4GEE1_PLUXY|nr:unnamed protein product [Plutella xylostella]